MVGVGAHWERTAGPLGHTESALGASCLASGSHWEHAACPLEHTGNMLPVLWITLGSHWEHATCPLDHTASPLDHAAGQSTLPARTWLFLGLQT